MFPFFSIDPKIIVNMQYQRLSVSRCTIEAYRPGVLQVLYESNKGIFCHPGYNYDTMVVAYSGACKWRFEHARPAVSDEGWDFEVQLYQSLGFDG